LSKPEERAEELIKRLKLDFKKNDGTSDAKIICFDKSCRNSIKIRGYEYYLRRKNCAKGVSIFIDTKIVPEYLEKIGFSSPNLYYDNKKILRPKNFQYTRSDWIHESDFVEIKEDISENNWNVLNNHDSLNDNIRIALIRNLINAIPELDILSFEKLRELEKKIVRNNLSNFPKSNVTDRSYLRWSNLIKTILSPNNNLEFIPKKSFQKKDCENIDLPIKVVKGMEKIKSGKLYILDNEIMDIWDKV